MKTFKEFIAEQSELLDEMVKRITDSPEGVLDDISWRFRNYMTQPNAGSQNHQIHHAPNGATTMIHHEVDGKPQAVSIFSNRENFSSHDLAHKLTGTGSQIRQNIVKMNELRGKPVISDGKQTVGGSNLWEKWREHEPDKIKLYRKANDQLTEIKDPNHPLVDGDESTVMGYHDPKNEK